MLLMTLNWRNYWKHPAVFSHNIHFWTPQSLPDCLTHNCCPLGGCSKSKWLFAKRQTYLQTPESHRYLQEDATPDKSLQTTEMNNICGCIFEAAILERYLWLWALPLTWKSVLSLYPSYRLYFPYLALIRSISYRWEYVTSNESFRNWS